MIGAKERHGHSTPCNAEVVTLAKARQCNWMANEQAVVVRSVQREQ
jgi:hypothetical protein